MVGSMVGGQVVGVVGRGRSCEAVVRLVDIVITVVKHK